MRVPEIALEVPRVLLPAPDVAVDTWAVIACDQHTSDPGYWDEVRRRVGDAPSTLDLVFPEVYLDADDRPDRLRAIRTAMDSYLERGLLVEQAPGFVLVDRQTPHAAARRGLMVGLDLERYSYAAEARTLIRTTEGTVLSRLPPRIEIRRDSPLELPHIMVLIDDPGRTVIEPLFDADLPALYDTELMLGGGHVRGWHVGTAHVDGVVDALRGLLDPADPEPFLYAMGDGNHSFATAHDVWEEIKREAGGLQAVADHPARHALVELVNLHDEGLVFEPIHRVLFGCDIHQLLPAMSAWYRAEGSTTEVETFTDRDAWMRAREAADERDDHHLPFVAGGTAPGYGLFTVHDPAHSLEAVSLQAFLTHYETEHPGMTVDYIHGDEPVERLGSQPDNVGLWSQVLDKHALFPTIRAEGPLPRKSFSLGEAEEKRYYLEARRIVP